MKHLPNLPTTVLLGLAEDAKALASYAETPERLSSAKEKLASIDTELLSRMLSYITVLNDSGNPVGFEPDIGEDNEYLSYLSTERQLYKQAQLDDDLDYGYYQDEMGG